MRRMQMAGAAEGGARRVGYVASTLPSAAQWGGASRPLWVTLAALVCAAGVAALVVMAGVPAVLALLVIGGMALGLLIRPELATVITAFLLYINFPAILTKQHDMPEFVAGSFILLLGFPIANTLIVRRERLRVNATFGLMLVWLAVLMLSSLQAVDEGIAVGRVQAFVLEGLLIYWLFFNTVRDLPTLRRTVAAVLAAGSLLGVLCLYQDVTGSYTQEFGGLAYRNYQSNLDAPSNAPREARKKWDRAQGPVDEPNRFAQILIVLLPFAVFMYRTAPSHLSRLTAAAAGVMVLVGIMLTLSRGAFVALVFMAFVMMAARWVRASHIVAGVFVVMVTLPAVTPFFIERVQSIRGVGYLLSGNTSKMQEADGAIRGRATEMLSAFHVFMDHPVLGVGPGQFASFYFERYGANADIKFRDIRGPRRAHTLYFETAAEVGAVGLFVFLLIVILLMRALWRQRRRWLDRNPVYADLATAAWLSLMLYLCTAIFLHLSYQRYYWFLLALAAAVLHIVRHDEAEPETAWP